ncbi:MAG TPA: hypothetical protein VLR94_05885, partial [Acidobacteriota bacterium]|nr:hypothetical protein [Acidobacteriota bacterium]
MSSLINTPGRELNRLMGQLGYPEQLGDLCGVALDKAIGSDPGLASNLLDVFSSMNSSQFDCNFQRGRMSDPGFCPPPQDTMGDSRNRFGGTYYQRERIHTYNIGKDASVVTIGGKLVDIGSKTTPADFEKRLLAEPNFRRQIEKQLGGRIVLDGNADGKVRVAKREASQEPKSPNPSRILKSLMQRVRDLLTGPAQTGSTAVPILPSPIVRDHRSASEVILPSPIVRDHRSESVATLPNPIV